MLVPLVLSAPAWAGTIDLDVQVDPTLASAAGVDPATVEQQMRDLSEDQLRMRALKEYLNQMANANSLATQGMGVDYATNPQRFVVGASIGSAACGAGLDVVESGDDLPEVGFAAEASAMAAVNLGAFSKDESFLRRFVFSVNGMYAEGQWESFNWVIFNYGAHLQFKLIRPKHEGLVEWGGLDVTGGYSQAFYSLTLADGYRFGDENLYWDAEGQLNVQSDVATIPLEVSSNLRVSVLTVFGGLGLDTRPWGSADASIQLGGDITAADPSSGQSMKIGTISATATETSPANTTAPRAFLGAQVNLTVVKIYAQANVGLERITTKSPTGDSFGAQVGVRVAL